MNRGVTRDKCSNICAVKFCSSTSKSREISLFRFPKYILRCKQWIINCNCEYLTKVNSNLYSSIYRVCSKQFKANCFVKGVVKPPRLLRNAIPTLNFPERQLPTGFSMELEELQTSCKESRFDSFKEPQHGLSTEPRPGSSKEPQPCSSKESQPGSSKEPQPCSSKEPKPGSSKEPQPGSSKEIQPWEELSVCVNVAGSSSPLRSPEASTQTPAYFSSHSSRKDKLRSKIRA